MRFWFCAANCYRGLLHNAGSKSVIACSCPFCFVPLRSNRHLWLICLCRLHAEIKPFGSQRCINLSEATKNTMTCSSVSRNSALSSVMVWHWGLPSLSCLTHSISCVRCICLWLCALGDEQGSDAGLVAVEGCDVKHVAVCANPDGLHLTIPGQRSRMGGAAWAEDLSTASTVVLPANDGEGSFAGNAAVTGFIRDPVWRVFELAFPSLCSQFWRGNGLLTESAVLKDCTTKNRTFILLIIVSLFTLGCHDFKQSLQDAAKVAGVVSLQLISNAWYTNKETVDEVTAAVEAGSDLVPGSHLGIL